MASASAESSEFRLSSLTLSTYIPTILFAIGQGAVIPVIPLFARELGSTVAAASLIVALRGLGQLVFDMPAGVAVSRWGDKGAMVAGTAMVAAVAVGAAFSSSVLVFGVLVFIMGGGWAFWQLARLAYVTEVTPVEQRGRAMSMLGGMSRVGNFIGPVVGGVLGQEFGLESAFLAQALMGVAAAAVMFLVVRSSGGSEDLGGAGLTARIVGTVVDNRRIFLTAGLSTVSLTVLRQARQVFLPLWGEEIGLDVAQIGLVTGISFATDALVFYPSGMIMDRFGRKWAAVPCSVILAASFFVLPFTQDIYSFMAVAALSGFGNGLGSGINMTLGADFSPDAGRGEFLGAWRVMADLGGVGGPVIISALTGLGSLALASVASGGIGLAGAAIMVFLVPETLRYRVARRRPGTAPGSAASST
jgi:MFS family permease